MTVENALDRLPDPTLPQPTPNNVPDPLTEQGTLLIILDSTRCPITGKQMREPVEASDGVTYEKENLETWIKDKNPPISPISLAIFDPSKPPTLNRAIKNLIEASPQEDEHTQPTPEIIMRVRLRVSLHWIVEWKRTIDKEEDFIAVFNTFISSHPIPSNADALPWPRQIDAPLCEQLASRCYKLDSITESMCCPISGSIMTDPVLMSDGITYDRANIEHWMTEHNNHSPVSEHTVTIRSYHHQNTQTSILKLHSVQSATLPPLLRVRLRVSLNWIVRSKFEFPNPTTLELAYNDFSMRRLPEDPWPLLHCPHACVEFVWAHCGHLRAMVYAEFANAARDVLTASNRTKQLATSHFVDSMRKHPCDSKTNQLSDALNSAYSVQATASNGVTYIRPFDVTRISTEWTTFWGDPRPQMPRREPSIYDPNVAMYPPGYFTNRRAGPNQNTQDSGRRVHYDIAGPQRTQTNGYGEYGYGEYGRFGESTAQRARGGANQYEFDDRGGP
jgi:hypothetical protein